MRFPHAFAPGSPTDVITSLGSVEDGKVSKLQNEIYPCETRNLESTGLPEEWAPTRPEIDASENEPKVKSIPHLQWQVEMYIFLIITF